MAGEAPVLTPEQRGVDLGKRMLSLCADDRPLGEIVAICTFAVREAITAEREACALEALATGRQMADRMRRSHTRRTVRRFAGFIADAIRHRAPAPEPAAGDAHEANDGGARALTDTEG